MPSLCYKPCVGLHLDLDQARMALRALERESRVMVSIDRMRTEEDGAKTPIYTREYLACREVVAILKDWIEQQLADGCEA